MAINNLTVREDNKNHIKQVAKGVLLSEIDENSKDKLQELERVHNMLIRLDLLIDRDYDLLFGGDDG